MQRLVARAGKISRNAFSREVASIPSQLFGTICKNHQEFNVVRGDFLKWVRLVSIEVRLLLLGSPPCKDIERAKTSSTEELALIWDDLIFCHTTVGGSGYTTMFVQVQMPYMILTGLEDYKARGTEASPYFTVSHYTEFAETKDLVLVRGDAVFTSKLTDEEAKWLMETAQSFYLNGNRFKLV